MRRAWVIGCGLVAAGVVAMGALLGACNPGPQTLPLSLYAEPETACPNEEIIVALENPTGAQLFIPAFWTGLPIYRKLVTETWIEHLNSSGFPAMHSTCQDRVQYSIPAGTLDPGEYKLVLQGRFGEEGIPFSLEVNLTISSLPGGSPDPS